MKLATLLLAIVASCGVLHAQPLTGLYTCANGNPGSAFDYGSIGTFFTDCENRGLGGPVVLEVYDDGGSFTSNASYGLGVVDTGGVIAIPGISATNTITVRAAAGESPVVTGSGGVASSFSVSATIAVQTSHVRFEGLELVGGSSCGISFYQNPLSNVHVRRMKVHGVTVGPGISVYSDIGGPIADTIIENNAIWNCAGGAAGFGSFQIGALAIRRAAPTTVVRHNTVIHNNGAAASAAFGYLGGSTGVANFVFEYNIFICTSSARPVLNFASTFDPPVCNYNYYYASNGATFHANSAQFPNFAAWQTSGRDPQGSDANPQLISLLLGTEDFHLSMSSPAIDAAVGSPTTIDVDGNPRPIGAAADIGADEAQTGPPPDMFVEYNAAPVADGGNFAAGNVSVVGVPFTFTIRNTGVGDLFLYGANPVQLTPGSNCAPGTVVQAQPALSQIPPTQSTTFTLMLQPANLGAFDLTINIPNNDPVKGPYNFTIQGTGVPANALPNAAPAAGSAFTGPINGPLQMDIYPGASLSNATVEITDPETDTIQVVSITAPTPAPSGIPVPALPAPGHPVVVTWTGIAVVTNPPGNYTWVLRFTDSQNTAHRDVDITITILDAPPEHTPSPGQAGTGTLADPYTRQFSIGVTGSVTVDIANVMDPNFGQVVTLTNQARTGGTAPGGSGFQFNLAGGILRVSPAGTLMTGDLGTQQYTIEVSDGANATDIIVLLTVNDRPEFVTTTLPDGTEGMPYSELVDTTDGTGVRTVALTAGSLPAGLSVNAAGTISGTPTTPGTGNFTLTVTDSQGANNSQVFNLTVRIAPMGTPVITTASPLPSGVVNASYTPVVFDATGGVAPYTWTIASGVLPTGLSLSSSGTLSGTPTVASSYTFTVRVTDAALVTATQSFDLSISNAPVPPPSAGGGGGGGGGCVAATGGSMLALLAMLPALVRRRRD